MNSFLLVFSLLLSFSLKAKEDSICSHLFATKSWKDEVALANQEIERAYQKGYQIQRLKKKEQELLISNSQKQMEQLKSIQEEILSTDKELIEINDSFINRLEKIYKEKGISIKVRKARGGYKILEFDFESSQPQGSVSSIYKTIYKKYGLKEITISLKENAEMNMFGFYNIPAKRMEVGPNQGLRLLDDYLTTIGKHESRHAMFERYREQGISSIFHMKFYGSQKKLLNESEYYEVIMSAEELYTHSTDLQKLINLQKKGAVNKPLINQIKTHVHKLKLVSETIIGVSDDLNKGLNFIPAERLSIMEDANKYRTLNFYDNFDRNLQIHLVSGEEHEIFDQYILDQSKYYSLYEEFFRKSLIAEGNHDLLSRYPGKLVPDDQAVILKIMEEFKASPEAKEQLEKLKVSSLPIIELIENRIASLRQISEKQTRDSSKLMTLINEYAYSEKGGKDEQLEEIKKLISIIDKRVKEGYKGFGI